LPCILIQESNRENKGKARRERDFKKDGKPSFDYFFHFLWRYCWGWLPADRHQHLMRMMEDLTELGMMTMTEAIPQTMTSGTAIRDMTERKAIRNMGNMSKRGLIMNITVPIGTAGIMNGVTKKGIITPTPHLRGAQRGALPPVSELSALEVLASAGSEVPASNGSDTTRPITRPAIMIIDPPIILP
jgi:hypothetical protein